MLTGTADPESLAADAPVARYATEPVELEGVEILQVSFEAESAPVASLLPPALHPTIPPVVNWVFWRVDSGPLGAFTIAQTRLTCRSGVRPRGYLVGAIVDGAAAATALAERWGFRCVAGEVECRRFYESARGVARVGGRTVLDVHLDDPVPLSETDVQYTANMNLARTAGGVRLVQVDPDVRVRRAERGRPRLVTFDGAAFGAAELRPTYPVAASIAVADVVLPRVRFVCRPDVFALEGTERVG